MAPFFFSSHIVHCLGSVLSGCPFILLKPVFQAIEKVHGAPHVQGAFDSNWSAPLLLPRVAA